MLSLIETLKEPPNFNPEPHFSFLVQELFIPLELVNKDNLGAFASVTSKKQHIVNEFIKSWKQYVGMNIYPATRLIFPTRDGRLYFLKDVAFARLITKMYKIPKNSIDYKRVNDWKKNYHDFRKYNSNRKKLRTLSVVLSQQVSERRLNEPKGDQVTIEEVNDVLDKLASDAVDTLEQQIELLEPFISKLSTEEVRWLFQIILKDSMIAPMESYFYHSWHPDAPQFSNVVNNLRVVFWRLTDVTQRLTEDEIKVQLMYPFLPQLAAKPKISYEDLAQKMDNNFYIEEKIDGDRMLMHMKRNPEDVNDMAFKYYTRRCRDYSMLYGNDLKYGAVSKYLRHAFHDGVKSIVLDGEMVAWDYRRNVILPFGTLKASAVQEAVRQFTTDDAFAEQSAWPFYIIYDILYLNGVHLSNTKLIERKAVLKKVINQIPHRFEVLDSPIAHTAKDIEEAMRKAVLERSEGVMVKNINLKYKIALRDNSWVKIKPEYLEQFGENLDLCIIGVIKGVKNAFMCALRDSGDVIESEEVGERSKSGVYKSFCTVGNGFSESEYDEILRITEGKWHTYKEEIPPADKVLFGAKKPDQWIFPEDSLVLEIKARAIDSEPLDTYAVGTTLHNLYCRRLREDKSCFDCVTVAEYKEIKASHSNEADKVQDVIKGNRKLGKKARVTQRQRLNPKALNVKAISTLFNGYTFMVLSGKLDKKFGNRVTDMEIKELIKKYGGTIALVVDMPKVFSNKLICISEVLTIKAKQMLRAGLDLVSPEWIFECVRYCSIMPIEPSLIFKSNNAEYYDRCKQKRLDEWGDSYLLHVSQPIIEYSREICVPKLEVKQESDAMDEDRRLLKGELAAVGIETLPYLHIFLGVKFYLVLLDEDPTWITEGFTRKISRYSGRITDNLDEASFVVFLDYDKYDFAKDQEMSQKAKHISKTIAETWSSNKRIPYMVHELFVDTSIKDRELADPQDYKI